MSDCERAISMLNEYIDGELQKNEAEFVRLHIESCSDCKNAYNELKKINELINEAPIEAPKELSVLVMDKIRSEKKRDAKKIFKIGSLVSAAAILVVLVSSPLLSFFMSGGAKAEADNDLKFDALAPEIEAPADENIYAEKTEGDHFYGADVEMPETDAITVTTATAILKDGTTTKIILDYNFGIARFDGMKYKLTKDGEKIILSNGDKEIIFEIKNNDKNTLYEIND